MASFLLLLSSRTNATFITVINQHLGFGKCWLSEGERPKLRENDVYSDLVALEWTWPQTIELH